jgi:hypothetical protein
MYHVIVFEGEESFADEDWSINNYGKGFSRVFFTIR